MTSKSGEKKATEGREEMPGRWSAHRKAEIALRLLPDEDLGEVSREIKVPPPTLEEWRRAFLERGQQAPKVRSRDPTEQELTRTGVKTGEMTMRLELASEFLEIKGGAGKSMRSLLKRLGT